MHDWFAERETHDRLAGDAGVRRSFLALAPTASSMAIMVAGLLSGCSDGLTLQGEVRRSETTPASLRGAASDRSVDVDLFFEFETEADTGPTDQVYVIGTAVQGSFPAMFTIDIPSAPGNWDDESGGVPVASAQLWIAPPGTIDEDGWTTRPAVLQSANYQVLFAFEEPGDREPFGVPGLEQGWNLLHRLPDDCDASGACWAHWEEWPLDEPLTVILEDGSAP